MNKLPFDKRLINQRELARRLDLDPSHLNRIINGKYKGKDEYAKQTIKKIETILKKAA